MVQDWIIMLWKSKVCSQFQARWRVFVISLFDITENEVNREPVLSVIEQFQEPATTA